MSVTDFEKEILAIDADIKDLTWAGGLFKYPFFKRIHEKPAPHVSAALDALRDGALTDQQKIIAALTMQRLPLKQFVAFGGQVLRLLEEGKVSHEVFRWAVLPTYEWNTALAENHRSKVVAGLLEGILRSPKVQDDLKAFVRDEVQTGQALKQIKYLRDIGQTR